MFSAARPGRALLRSLRTTVTPRFLPSSYLVAPRRRGPAPTAYPELRWLHTSLSRANSAQAQTIEDEGLENNSFQDGPVTEFEELADRSLVNPKIIATVRRMGIETMTPVQSKTINETLKGIDVLAQAKTGTGKTIAFLLPVIERILERDPGLISRRERTTRPSVSDVRAIIVSPTRELAEQIATEAVKIVHGTGIVVQCATGGTQKRVSLSRMQYEGCDILVGTPGRLTDLLSDHSTGVAAPNIGAFVLDEADRLLDDGFLPTIRNIQRLLPDPRKVDRQTLLFSATVPEEILDVVRATMKPDFKFVRTVSKDEVPTHEKVPQRVVECRALQNQLAALLELCHKGIESAKTGEARPFKAIVYFASTAEVSLAATTFGHLRDAGSGQGSFAQNPLAPADLLEIHSRLTQQQRTRTATQFRRAKSAILFSSDVTARGMDFPDVTHVIQVGLPSTRDQYIHRLGRTARAHKTGEGWMIVSSIEMREYRKLLAGLPIEPDESLAAAKVNMTKDGQISRSLAVILTQLGEATKRVDSSTKTKAYMAALGIYSRFAPDKQMVVDLVNEWARFGWGFPEPPRVAWTLAQKIGYGRTVGLNLVNSSQYDEELGGRDNSRGGRQGFGGRGSSFGDRGSSFGGRRSSSGDRGSSFGDRRSSSGDRGSSFGDRRSSFGDRGSNFGDRGSSFGNKEPSFGSPRDGSSSFAERHGDRSGGFRNGVSSNGRGGGSPFDQRISRQTRNDDRHGDRDRNPF